MEKSQINIYTLLRYTVYCHVAQPYPWVIFLFLHCMGFDAVSVCVVEQHQSSHYKAI